MSTLHAVLSAEWAKIRTVRSTLWTLVLTFITCVGIGFLVGRSFDANFSDMSPGGQESFDPLFAGFYSLTLGQIALVVFGVLLVSTEYSSGTIRASLAAVPRRGLFFGAKVLVGTVTALLISLGTVFATFFTAQEALGPHGTSLAGEGALRATLGASTYMTLMCAFAMGVAALLRSSALSLSILIPVLFLGSQGVGNIPKVGAITQYLPDQAGITMMQGTQQEGKDFFMAHDFGPWTGLAILMAWTTAALLGGYLSMRQRDA
jgi:ABC-2 type transport system permease protein